jgi:hypothetical protein
VGVGVAVGVGVGVAIGAAVQVGNLYAPTRVFHAEADVAE